jgi:hypothetical protein
VGIGDAHDPVEPVELSATKATCGVDHLFHPITDWPGALAQLCKSSEVQRRRVPNDPRAEHEADAQWRESQQREGAQSGCAHCAHGGIVAPCRRARHREVDRLPRGSRQDFLPHPSDTRS